MADVLVVCFSRTGSSEAIARMLADRLGADLDLVRSTDAYRGPLGFLRGVLQSVRKSVPHVTSQKSPGKYAVVVVGAPVWASGLAAPMRTYLAQHGPEIRAMALFSVSGRGGRFEPFFAEAEALVGVPPVATLALSQRVAARGTYLPEFEPFLTAVRGIANQTGRRLAAG